MLKSGLRDYGDAYLLVKETIIITGAEEGIAATRQATKEAGKKGKRVMFKNCPPFTDCISEIRNLQVDNAKYLDFVMPMYNLIEYNDNCLKTYGSLWQYYKDELNSTITNSESFKSKLREIRTTPAAGNRKDAETAVALKYLSNFWRILEIPLNNCEINLIPTFSANCVINNFTSAEKFAITDTKLYVPVLTLLT